MPDMVWDRHNVFISYNRDDRKLAEEVHRGLEQAGFRCWMDDRINLGVEFWDVICRAISQAQVVLVVVKPTTQNSPWVLREIDEAREQQRHIVPVLVGARPEDRQPEWLWPDASDLNAHQMLTAQDVGGELTSDEVEAGIAALVERLQRDEVGSLRDRIDHDLLLDRLGETPLDATDLDRLKWLTTETFRHFSGTPSEDYPTVHGLRHSNGILTALNGLLPPPLREDRQTVFALAAAACVHDWGRCRRSGPSCSSSEAACLRGNHHGRSRAAVYELAGEAELSPDEALLIADLCYYHNVRTNLHELSARPEAAEAAALFRLANACDLGLLRGPSSYWELYGKDKTWGDDVLEECFPDELPPDGQPQSDIVEKIANAAFWMRSQMVSGVRTDRDSRTITVFVAQSGPALSLVSCQAKDYLKRMLLQLQPLIGKWQVELDESKRAPGMRGFTLPDCILLGASAYTDPEAVVTSSSAVADYFVSSALALAEEVEAVRRRVEAGAEATADDLTENVARVTLRRLVNGLILQRPELQLLHWLSKELDATTARPVAELGAHFGRIKRGRQPAPLAADGPGCFACDYPLSAIARNAYGELPKQDKLTFVVFGHSRPVKMLIQHCSLAGRDVLVYVPLMRPVGEGPTLQAVEALEGLQNVTVEIVPDVALAHVLSAPEAKYAHGLMGCEVWIGRRDELIASSLGCLTFAHIVKGCGRPLWVLAEQAKKISDASALSPYRRRPAAAGNSVEPHAGRQLGQLDVSAYVHEAEAARCVAEEERKEARTFPRSETVPLHLIDAIISDQGVHRGYHSLFWTSYIRP